MISLILPISLLISDGAVNSESAAPKSQAAPLAADGSKEIEKPLDISGQNRNLSMMMVLKGDREDINFVQIRRNYEDEVPKTLY